jgi:hypothetical protein
MFITAALHFIFVLFPMLTYVDAVYDQKYLYIPLVFSRAGAQGHISLCYCEHLPGKGLTTLKLWLLSTCVCIKAYGQGGWVYSSHSSRQVHVAPVFPLSIA